MLAHVCTQRHALMHVCRQDLCTHTAHTNFSGLRSTLYCGHLICLLIQVEEMERGVLGSVPDKAGSSDYYSEGIIITDVADPYNCPLLWLNTICKEMLGDFADCCMLFVTCQHACPYCISSSAHGRSPFRKCCMK